MNEFFIGQNPVQLNSATVKGHFEKIHDEKFYRIEHAEDLKPFFISLASDSDLWMYIASTGGLTAGRKNPDAALFPYYTDDKIMESSEHTGSKTIFHVSLQNQTFLWEPFSNRNRNVYKIERSIAKSVVGNKLQFTERNVDLGLEFSYTWMNSDEFGWIKKSELLNLTSAEIQVYVIDGLQNILPSGIDRLTQNTFSTLVDGYKKTERINQLALFRMEAILVDRAEPSESLLANTVWCCGLEQVHYLLSSEQLDNIRKGKRAMDETESKGVRGAFFAGSEIHLKAHESKHWYFVSDVNQDATAVINLLELFSNKSDLKKLLEASIAKGTEALKKTIAQADGFQQTADEHVTARHFSNVLFNTMRGGIYAQGYRIQTSDFRKHITHFQTSLYEKHRDFLLGLPVEMDYFDLEKRISKVHDVQLHRLFSEYLPLTFSRRHGDPSRPWNLFNINVKDENGQKLLSYQGNWRDIFQNWEALSVSYPGYVNGILAKFLNATTVDGYNPYKISNEGIEWEVIEPENPWSNIGYWGDHQIVYLLRLLELSMKHNPDDLINLLDKEQFAFANVPYRLKSYDEIVAEPKNSIRFDEQLHHSIEEKVALFGADAKLVFAPNGEVLLVNFSEKLLISLLAKLSNFIPEAGIWMNTLRPEWNDANNALVGSGASMVTLYHMRRFVLLLQVMFQQSHVKQLTFHAEVFSLLVEIQSVFSTHRPLLKSGFDNRNRKTITDALGHAGSRYRTAVYQGFGSSKQPISTEDLVDFCNLTLEFIDQSIRANKRADNLFHAYNLVRFTTEEVTIRPLYEMLEGQVAVLSAGLLTAKESLDLLDALRASKLFRADQQSYMLYPNKHLPLFLEKNNLLESEVLQIKRLREQLEAGDTSIIKMDAHKQYHFRAEFKNVGYLIKELEQLGFDDQDQKEITQLYEKVFDHQSFTGRSGSFYKYEGLGCIYWHMVSKLLLAIGECIQHATRLNADNRILQELKNHYRAVQQGIGSHKNPKEYGAFPFDPYSHTPTMAGVQQPGMTGQVKEDILSRFLELGVIVENGQLTIQPSLLNDSEFIRSNGGSIAPYLMFTYCNVPFIYVLDGGHGLDFILQDGTFEQMSGYVLSKEQSQAIFKHDHRINKVIVHF
ncbi:MAG TPA: hypothetical protein VFP20_10590 [Bacteroidales bacterium]|nr:hypothetical protein [Bacteroidales bacterium]